MKFENGRWLMKSNIEPMYAAELYEWEYRDNKLLLLVPSVPIRGRGDTQSPALLVEIFCPAEGILGVTAVHHKGAAQPGPFFPLQKASLPMQVAVDADAVEVSNGMTRARILRGKAAFMGGFGIAFYQGDQFLTRCGYHGIASMADRDTGRHYMCCGLNLDVGECVYGLGERFTPFVKNGQVVDIWQADGGTSSEQAYKNIPFYMTNRGYGVFVDSPGDVSFEVASENVECVRFSEPGERMTFYVIAGPQPRDVLRRYTHLTGRPALPPAWSMGLWLSTSFTTNYDEATVTSFIQGMEEREIPLRVFHFDCFWMRAFRWCDFLWDGETFPDPEGLLKRLKARGLQICVWINPYISQQSRLFEEGMEKGYLVMRRDGSVWQSDLWQTGMALVDFTNPAACSWYREYLRGLLHMGVDCFKTDFGERVPVRDIVWHDGSDPLRMHNYYAYLYNACVFGLLQEERGEGDAVVFARSATACCQRFPTHWGGDNSASYISMAETLRAGLSMAMSGFGFWSHDIAGFEQTAPADVYKRWCQFGLLSSHSRLHGSQSYRVPWLFDEEASVVLREMSCLKNRLMPYLYGCARDAHEEGTPVMRPMAFAFMEDPACDYLDRQYMLGDSLLVAPIFREDGMVDYYLPQGCWTHLLDGRVEEGGRWIRERYDFHSLPLWVRPNTLLPWGACQDRPDYDYAAGCTLRLYGFEDGGTAQVVVPDVRGGIALQAKVRREGPCLYVHTEGCDQTLQIEAMQPGLDIIRE